MKITNREHWLTVMSNRYLWPALLRAGCKKPRRWRVSLGFPKGSRGGKGSHAIGQCWSVDASADGHTEIFVSPELNDVQATETLLHELIHAGVGLHHGHKGEFKRVFTEIGFIGRTRSGTPSEPLAAKIEAWIALMPKLKHAPLALPPGKENAGPGSRLVKVFCPDCGYTMRIARTWLEIAIPKCPSPECDSTDAAMMTEG